MQCFPFPASRGKGTPWWTPKVDDTKGYMTPGHSNWTICSLWNLFLQNGFPLYSQATCSSSLFLHQVKWAPLSKPQKWMTPRGVWLWDIQIRSFAVYETYFCKMNFHFLNKPHAAFPFSCMQRKGHPTVNPKSEWHQGVCNPGAFKPHATFPFPAWSE